MVFVVVDHEQFFHVKISSIFMCPLCMQNAIGLIGEGSERDSLIASLRIIALGGLSQLVIKFKRLKNHLKWWNRDVFRNAHDKFKALDLAASKAEEDFDVLQSEENRVALSLARANLALGLSMEEVFWKQKASAKCILDGEPNALAEPNFDYIPDSVAGPDAVLAGFYRNCWEIIKDDVTDAFRDFWLGSPLFQSITATSVMLIPKTPNAQRWADFRPISLCNEMVNHLNYRPRGGNIIMKLDMAKAYDRVQWDFLYQMLRAVGFSEEVCQVILRCVNNCWFSVIINGSLSGLFHSNRGLRQGNPISLSLFVIAAEYLSRVLDNLFAQHRMLNYSTGRSFRLSHFSHADDIIIFTNGSTPVIKILQNFLHHYEQCSRQLISNAKSAIITASNCPPERKGNYYGITGFREGSLPIRYLGSLLFLGPRKTSYFSHIIFSASKKLQGWNTQILSFGSSLVLHPPGTVLHRFEMLCAKFLWGAKEDARKIHWIAWEKICLPILEGGFGIRRLKDSVTAFSIKLWVQFRSVDSLWSRFLMMRYCKSATPDAVRPMQNISPTWRRMMKIRDRAEQGIGWRIGDG
ncbi:uncharacterized protein [Henckelia pumila]|uniref:uncharacterized protein n=1 Tax=Henckelia pumila TaxID=405737 RepID=UPI003C6E3B1F